MVVGEERKVNECMQCMPCNSILNTTYQHTIASLATRSVTQTRFSHQQQIRKEEELPPIGPLDHRTDGVGGWVGGWMSGWVSGWVGR